MRSEDGTHALSYELGWRLLADPSQSASQAVLSQLGHNLKSAAKYVHQRETINDPYFPSAGWGFR